MADEEKRSQEEAEAEASQASADESAGETPASEQKPEAPGSAEQGAEASAAETAPASSAKGEPTSKKPHPFDSDEASRDTLTSEGQEPREEQRAAAESAEPEVAAAARQKQEAIEAEHSAPGTSEAHQDEHFAHITPMPLLLGVLVALILLTVLTVGVTAIDLGSQGNFVVAMIIATVKAGLVMAYFMHLVWDSKFNVLVFLSSFLFVLLFLSMALLDRQEYQDNVDEFENTQAAMQ